VDDEPYQKIINIPMNPQSNSEYTSGSQLNHMSLKDCFQAKEALWKPIFGNYVSAGKQPLFSIFRKKVESREITI
jgi:hypothetical protein